MDGRIGTDPGVTLRTVVRLGLLDGVPAYVAAIAVILFLLVLSALR